MLSPTKSRNAGKQLLVLSILFTICSCYITVAQDGDRLGRLYVIELDKANKNFVNELRLDVSPGDSIQFKSVDGDFAIYIVNAISFLSIPEQDLKVQVNSSNPESEIYCVQTATDKIENIYSIYCITCNSWPDAPPRIIISSDSTQR
ncbi:MAG TPA: hypothetical protein VIZ21_03175 [Ignavibacteriaceae bacterium]